jgi:hypothetical protein
MNNEDTTADVRISNWTLATKTTPQARDISSSTSDDTRRAPTESAHDASYNVSPDGDHQDVLAA